jgi:hypothetical protein
MRFCVLDMFLVSFCAASAAVTVYFDTAKSVPYFTESAAFCKIRPVFLQGLLLASSSFCETQLSV